jgi:hypothetical protein
MVIWKGRKGGRKGGREGRGMGKYERLVRTMEIERAYGDRMQPFAQSTPRTGESALAYIPVPGAL